MPGANARALDKAKTLAADVLILDLEDAVATDAKASARRQVCDIVAKRPFGTREVVVRINALSTAWGRDDAVAVAAAAGADALLLPKVDRPGDIAALQGVLDHHGADPRLAIWAMMETPRSVLDALAIAASAQGAAPRLAALVVGTNDLQQETRMRAGPDRTLLIPWLTTLILAARACGLAILDGVSNDFSDLHRFSAECAQGRALGMDGKTLVHPRQIEPCNTAFAPSEAEIAWARKVVEAFEQPGAESRNVVQVEGQMVERLHLEPARRDLAAARTR